MTKNLPAWFSGRGLVIAIPFAFLLAFFLLPFLIVGKISVSEMETVSFKDIVTWSDGVLALTLKFSNYIFITQDSLYFKTYLASLQYAAATRCSLRPTKTN